MTSKQPEALRLAFILEQGHDLRDEEAAAAELRRLHSVNLLLINAILEADISTFSGKKCHEALAKAEGK